jgi:hypothetical protein
MGFSLQRNSSESLRSDSLFIIGYEGYSSFIDCFRRTVTIGRYASSRELANQIMSHKYRSLTLISVCQGSARRISKLTLSLLLFSHHFPKIMYFKVKTLKEATKMHFHSPVNEVE